MMFIVYCLSLSLECKAHVDWKLLLYLKHLKDWLAHGGVYCVFTE